jgi:hypothetical protein
MQRVLEERGKEIHKNHGKNGHEFLLYSFLYFLSFLKGSCNYFQHQVRINENQLRNKPV